MKYTFSIIAGLLVASVMYAANTANVTLTLTGNGGSEASQLKLRIDPDVTEATTATWFPNTESTGTVNLYAEIGGEKYSQYKYKSLTNTPLVVVTNRREAAQQHYTITFAVFANTEVLYLTDMAVDKDNPIAITNGGTYEFDVNTTLHPDYVAGTNYVVKDRFVINYARIPDTGDLALCFQYGKLTINNNPYLTNIVIKDEEGDTKMDVESANTPQEIDLSALAAGQYTVEIGTEKFIILK